MDGWWEKKTLAGIFFNTREQEGEGSCCGDKIKLAGIFFDTRDQSGGKSQLFTKSRSQQCCRHTRSSHRQFCIAPPTR